MSRHHKDPNSIYGHEFGDGGMHDPDWGRVLVPKGKISPLGDPTRWGARVVQDIPADPVGLTVIQQRSPQIINVVCQDGYSRAWSIAGTMTASQILWGFAPQGATPLPDQWYSALSVQMGVGQNAFTHNFNLRAIIEADAAYYLDSDFELFPANLRTRPFVIPGAIVANNIAIQTVQLIEYSAPHASEQIVTQVQVTPFNPGTGL